MFEIALVRLSETSDYLIGQVNNPLAVTRQTSEKLQPDFICHYIMQSNAKTWGIQAAIVTMLLLASNAFEVWNNRRHHRWLTKHFPVRGCLKILCNYDVCQLVHWQNLWCVLGIRQLKEQHYCKEPYQGNHWLIHTLLAFKDDAWMEKTRLPCIQTMCYWFV